MTTHVHRVTGRKIEVTGVEGDVVRYRLGEHELSASAEVFISEYRPADDMTVDGLRPARARQVGQLNPRAAASSAAALTRSASRRRLASSSCELVGSTAEGCTTRSRSSPGIAVEDQAVSR